MIPMSPYDPNVMLFHPLVSKIWARTKMAHSLPTIGRYLECAIQTKPVVELELALIERKQSRRFRHNSIICQKDSLKDSSRPRAWIWWHRDPLAGELCLVTDI